MSRMFNIILMLTVFFFCALVVQARESRSVIPQKVSLSGMAYSSSYEEINMLKTNVYELLSENQNLQSEYEGLKKQYEQLAARLKEHENKLNSQKLNDQKNKHYREYQFDTISDLNKSVQQLQNDILIMDSRILYIKAQLIDLDDKESILRLKKADLSLEKQDLELELKRAVQNTQKPQVQQEDKLTRLKRTLEERLQQEENLKNLIIEIEQKQITTPAQEQELTQEIGRLEKELSQLKDLYDIRQTEVELISSKMSYKEKSVDGVVRYKKDKKDDLEKTVTQLESEYMQMAEKIDNSYHKKQSHAQMVEDIIGIDKENQQLREKISTLQEKIKDLTL